MKGTRLGKYLRYDRLVQERPSTSNIIWRPDADDAPQNYQNSGLKRVSNSAAYNASVLTKWQIGFFRPRMAKEHVRTTQPAAHAHHSNMIAARARIERSYFCRHVQKHFGICPRGLQAPYSQWCLQSRRHDSSLQSPSCGVASRASCLP